MNLRFKLIKAFFFALALTSLSMQAAAYNFQYADAARTVPLRWKTNKIPIALSTSLIKQNPNIAAESDTVGAVRRSLETWEKAAGIQFETGWTDLQTVSPSGNSGDGISLITIAQTPENLLLFSNETEDVSARTRVFFNRKGYISEADIVLNPYQQFSTDGSIGTFDLESTITHELGHLLGLEHSSISSATMYSHQGKNGTMNLSAFDSRTLAEDDITGVRALYGANNGEESCCGKIQGKLVQASGKPARDFQVWAEDADSGRLISAVTTGADGAFTFEGLREGNFKIYAQNSNAAKGMTAAEEIGQAEVKKGRTFNLAKKLKSTAADFSLQYVGFNGQLSELAVPLNGGKSYVIYVGGKNLDEKGVKINFDSPYLSVTPKTVSRQDFGAQISVISFEVKVEDGALPGEYSIVVEKNGAKQYIVGGLTIEKFSNPWSIFDSTATSD